MNTTTIAALLDDCVATPPDTSQLPFRIGSVFIIFVTSLLGVLSTLNGNLFPNYVITFAKTIGSGILLACSLVHLLQPASQSLTSPCVPYEFNTDYQAYAFLYCMLAFLFMQWFKNYLNSPSRSWVRSGYLISNTTAMNTNGNMNMGSIAEVTVKEDIEMAAAVEKEIEMVDENAENRSNGKDEVIAQKQQEVNDRINGEAELIADSMLTKSEQTGAYLSFQEAVACEVAFLLHSVIIGLTTGLSSNDELHSLVIALSFHQCFEGVALGARLFSSKFSLLVNTFLVLLFACSSPAGIAAGVSLITANTLNVNGETFLLTQGTLDGVTSGLLLHIAATKLIVDFPRDCLAEELKGHYWHMIGLYVAVSLGAGFMAYIGKYL